MGYMPGVSTHMTDEIAGEADRAEGKRERIAKTDILLKPDWRKIIIDAMTARRHTDRSIALAARLGATTVNEWFRKGNTPSLRSLMRVLDALDLPISAVTEGAHEVAAEAFEASEAHAIAYKSATPQPSGLAPRHITYARLLGTLKIGSWQEGGVEAVDDPKHVPTVPHSEFGGLPQFAWRVDGTGMNRIAKAGSYVVGVSFDNVPRGIQHRDLVVCERRDGDKFERSLRRVIVTPDGIRLDTESDDPKHQAPVWLSSGDGGEVAVRATHLIIGAFTFLA